MPVNFLQLLIVLFCIAQGNRRLLWLQRGPHAGCEALPLVWLTLVWPLPSARMT